MVGIPARLGVCVLIQQYHPYVGGAERQLEARVAPLRRRGVDVHVVTRQEPGLPSRAVIAGAPVYRVPTTGGRIARSTQFTLGALRTIVQLRSRIQILYAYSPFSPATAALLGKALLRRPVVLQLLGGGPHGDLGVLRTTRSGPIRLGLLRRGVDRFVALSGELEAELLAAGVPGSRVVRVANGVDARHYRSAGSAARQALRARLGLGERPVVLFVGRLVPYKGLETLLAAWPAVLRDHPTALLLLVGDGPLGVTLRARAGPGVRFEGLVSDPLPYLQAADCFVLPSEGEGMPSALLEALAVGLPCVATSVGGIPEVLRRGPDGWLVPPRSSEALADALQQALASGQCARRAGARHERDARELSLDATAERLVELFRELVGPDDAPAAPR